MAKEKTVEFLISGSKYEVNLEKMESGERDDLEDKVLEVRKHQSIYFKYPFDEGETDEEWKVRVKKLNEEEFVRKEGETEEQHLNRMFDNKDGKKNVLDLLNCIAAVFWNKEFTSEDIRKTRWGKLNKDMLQLFTYCRIAAADLDLDQLGK